MHYTDRLPPLSILKEFPNWKYDFSKEGQPGCHEGTLWCCKRHDKIRVDVDFTAGDVFLADGRTYPALIGVAGDDLDSTEEIRVYYEDRFWTLVLTDANTTTGKTGLWKCTDYRGDLHVSLDDTNIFPMSFCTHLESSETNRTISGVIELGGRLSEWNVYDLWDNDALPQRRKKKLR